MKFKTDDRDLDILVDMRNGIVHAAENVEVEERILAAFAQHADVLLEDLGHDRKDFWGGQLTVVDALLKDASDKLAHRVEVRLAAAGAWLEHRYATEGKAVIDVVRALSNSAVLTHGERFRQCPVCGSQGIATGEHSVEYEPTEWDEETGKVTDFTADVWFGAGSFRCNVCGLRLDSQAEIHKVFDPVWQIEDADWRQYESVYNDEDDVYERWREERDEPLSGIKLAAQFYAQTLYGLTFKMSKPGDHTGQLVRMRLPLRERQVLCNLDYCSGLEFG